QRRAEPSCETRRSGEDRGVDAQEAGMRWAMGTLGALAVLAGASVAVAKDAAWACPAGFDVKAGLNTDFPFEGEKRAFVVYPPEGDAKGPAPVWVPLTGSVESTNANLTVPRPGANSLLAKQRLL